MTTNFAKVFEIFYISIRKYTKYVCSRKESIRRRHNAVFIQKRQSFKNKSNGSNRKIGNWEHVDKLGLFLGKRDEEIFYLLLVLLQQQVKRMMRY